jgi:integrase
MLSKEEIHYAFSVFHTQINSFGRDNYLACCLFLVLGVRKSELCEAMWREMDLTTGVWDLPKERSKTGVPISIPLLEQPNGIGHALTQHCLRVLVVLAPWLTLKLTFYVIVSLGRKLGLIPPARPTHSLGYEESPLSF